MKNFFCGIDISLKTLDYAMCYDDKELLEEKKTANSKSGIKKLIKDLLKKSDRDHIWVCCEHTGNYGLLLAKLLKEHNIKFSMVSALEIKKSIGITRGKNDKVDAKRITEYIAANNYKVKPTELPADELLKLKSLMTTRRQQIKIRTQLKNARKSLLIVNESINIRESITFYNKEIRRLDKVILSIEEQFIEVVKQSEDMLTSYKKLTSIIGIGLINAVSLIIITNNFKSFDNPRKFNCYAGIAPFEHKSGTSVHQTTKTSNFRNKSIKAVMYNIAHNANKYDPQINAFFKRKKAEGKNEFSIKNAIACKMVYRIFAVMNREEPYVKMAM